MERVKELSKGVRCVMAQYERGDERHVPHVQEVAQFRPEYDVEILEAIII